MTSQQKDRRLDWIQEKLSAVSTINPKLLNKNEMDDDFEVQFVPMKLVDEVADNIHLEETRKFNEVQKKSYTYFEEGDVLFAKVTPCMENGKIAVARNLKNGIGYGSSEFHVFRCKPILNNQYLFYYLVQSNFRRAAQHAMTGAVGLRRVPKKFLENHLLPLPPLPEQRAIVAKLEHLFAALDRGEAQLRTARAQLGVYRQAVLQQAFAGELTNTEEFNGVQLGEVCNGVEYGTSAKSKKSGEVPVLRMGNIQDGRIQWDDLKFSSDPEEIEKYQLRPGDVLFNRTNSPEHVGKTAIYRGERDAIFAGYLIRINYDKQIINGDYLNYFLNSPEAKIYGNKVKSFGVNQSNINGTKLKKYPFPLTSIEEQNQIVQAIESRLSVCDNLERTIDQGLEQAAALRQSLLKKAFAGELLTAAELTACRAEADWVPAGELLAQIKGKGKTTDHGG